MICVQCRYELPDTAKFCRSCGKPQLVGLLEVSAKSAPVKNSKVVSARAKAPANVEAEPAKAVRARAKAPANAAAEPAKAVRARAKAPANAAAEPTKAVRARAKALANSEAEPAKAVRAKAKVPDIAEAEPAKAVRARAKAPGKLESELVKAVRSRTKAPAYAETEPLNGAITKQPATANIEVAEASIATSQAVTSIPLVKSKLFVYIAIATVMIAIVCAVSYWGWAQSALPEEQKNLASDSHAEEERLKKEAEEKAKQQAEADKSKKEKEESDSKVAETSAALKWTGRYQCSELLLPGAKVRNEFSVDIAFTTTSGKGVFLRQTNDFVEKFTIDINGTKVDISSEGNRIADPSKKWFTKTTGTFFGKNINTSGSMFGADGQQIIRQNCKTQLTLVSIPAQTEKVSVTPEPQKSPAPTNAISVINLQSLSIEIGAQKIVECTLESFVVDVQLSGNTENTQKLKFIAGLTAKAYSALANAYPNKKELAVFSDLYPKINPNPALDERLKKIIACSADERVKTLLKDYASKN